MRSYRLKAGTALAAILAISATAASAASDDIATTPDKKSKVETVVVTASPIAGDPDRFATIVSSVDRNDILQSGGANLADALAKLPGISTTGFAAGASRPVIRGFDANRVRILEDGIGSFDVSEVGPDHGVPIDPLSAQRIEVVRGAATLRYGSQAIGGVVNAINNRVPLSLGDEPLSAEFTGTYGSNADLYQASLSIDGKIDNFALHADTFSRNASDYGIPHGTQSNSFFEGDGYSLGSSYFLTDNSRVGAAIIHYDARYGIPGEATYIDMKQTKYLERSSFDLGFGPLKSLTIDGGYADYTHSEIDPGVGPASTFNDTEWDTRAEALFDAIGPLSASAVGVQLQHREFSALGEGADYLLPTTTETAAVFAFTEAPIGSRIHLQAGARVENVKIDGTPSSGIPTSLEFTPVSGSIGALFDLTDSVKFGLTASSAARAPAQTELFAIGPHDGPATFETGDPTLKIERANSLESTLRVNLDKVTFEGSLWGSWFKNYIYGQLTGRTCDDTGFCVPGNSLDLKELFYMQQDAKFWGFEAKTSIALGSFAGGDMEADILGDYVRATFNAGGNVPRIPPYKAGGGLNWYSDNVDIGFLLMRVGEQTEVGTGETGTKGYMDLGAHVNWRPFPSHPDWQLSLVGHNLLDSTERDAIALNKDEVIQPGRDVQLVLRLKT